MNQSSEVRQKQFRDFDVQWNLSKPNPEYDGFMCKSNPEYDGFMCKPNPEYDGFMCKPNLKSLLKSTV